MNQTRKDWSWAASIACAMTAISTAALIRSRGFFAHPKTEQRSKLSRCPWCAKRGRSGDPGYRQLRLTRHFHPYHRRLSQSDALRARNLWRHPAVACCPEETQLKAIADTCYKNLSL